MPFSYADFASKSPGDTIPVPFPYLLRDHVYVAVAGTVISSSLYEWTSDGLLTCLSGFPAGSGRVYRQTPKALAGEQKGTGTYDYNAANANDLALLYILQETEDAEAERQAAIDTLEDAVDEMGEDVTAALVSLNVAVDEAEASAVTATTKASEASASAAEAAADVASLRISTVGALQVLSRATLADGRVFQVTEKDNPKRGGRFLWWADLTLPHDGGLIVRHSDGQPGGFVRLYSDDVWWLEWWDARPGVNAAWAEQNSDALDAALGAWLAHASVGGREISTGPGRWWFSREHFVGSDATWRNLTISGPGLMLCSWETTLSGADSRFLRNDPNRYNSLYLRGINFITRNAAGTVCPILIEDMNFHEGLWHDVKWTQGSQDQISNTLVVTSGWWNAKASHCRTYGGGHFRSSNTAMTETVRFGLTAGDETVTATEAVFSGTTPGSLWYFGEQGGAWIGEVASVAPDGLSVEMTTKAPYTKAEEYGWADGVRCSTTAGSDIIDLDADVAVEADIGRYVGILGAGSVRGRRSVHVAKIIDVPTTSSYQLDRAATYEVENERLYLSPAVLVIYDPSDPFNNITNDADLVNFDIEYPRGCGLLIEDGIDINGRNLKLHGAGSVGQGYKPDLITQAGAIIGARSCYIEQGNIEGSCFDDGRIILTGANQASFNSFSGLRVNRQAIIWSRDPYGQNATIKLGDVALYNKQYDIDAAGNGLPEAGFVPMLSGPVPVGSVGRQTLIHWGETVEVNDNNKRLVHGRGGQILACHNVMGEHELYVGTGSSKKILLPPLTRLQNGIDRGFRILIKASGNNHADFGVELNKTTYRSVKLLMGDTAVWATSNDVGPQQTTGKITISVDNDGWLHIDNRLATNAYFNFHYS